MRGNTGRLGLGKGGKEPRVAFSSENSAEDSSGSEELELRIKTSKGIPRAREAFLPLLLPPLPPLFADASPLRRLLLLVVMVLVLVLPLPLRLLSPEELLLFALTKGSETRCQSPSESGSTASTGSSGGPRFTPPVDTARDGRLLRSKANRASRERGVL